MAAFQNHWFEWQRRLWILLQRRDDMEPPVKPDANGSYPVMVLGRTTLV